MGKSKISKKKKNIDKLNINIEPIEKSITITVEFSQFI